MNFYKIFIVLLAVGVSLACAGTNAPATPLETLKAYTIAVKKKDTAAMKSLLSDASLKMAQEEAKAQNVPVDEIVKRETLFGEDQTRVEFRNEKVEGDKATIEVGNSFGSFETVPFVREEGVWKIDKQGVANQMLEQMDRQNRRLDDIINQGSQPQ